MYLTRAQIRNAGKQKQAGNETTIRQLQLETAMNSVTQARAMIKQIRGDLEDEQAATSRAIAELASVFQPVTEEGH